MKSSEILREAARMIESGESRWGMCLTITRISFNVEKREVAINYWLRQVAREGANDAFHWFGLPAYCGTDQSFRITAACMAAAIAESEGD